MSTAFNNEQQHQRKSYQLNAGNFNRQSENLYNQIPPQNQNVQRGLEPKIYEIKNPNYQNPLVISQVTRHENPVSLSQQQVEANLRNKCMQLELALTEVQTEVMRLRSIGMCEKVTYVEDTLKLNQLYLEIDRLNRCLLEQSRESDQWKNQYLLLEAKGKRNISEIDIDKMSMIMQENESNARTEIIHLKQENEQWQKRFRIIELSLNEQIRSSTSKKLEDKLNVYIQDFERVSIQLQDKNNECEEYKSRSIKQSNQLREFPLKEVENRRLRELIDSRNKEIEALRIQMSVQSDNLGRVQYLESETLRLNSDLSSKLQLIDELKFQLINNEALERVKKGNQNSEIEMNQLRERLESIQNKYYQLENEYNQQKQNLMFAQEKEKQYKDEMENLNNHIKQLNQEIEENKDNIFDLENQLNELTEISYKASDLTQEVETWKQKFISLNREYHKIQEELTMATSELDSLKIRYNRVDILQSGYQTTRQSQKLP